MRRACKASLVTLAQSGATAFVCPKLASALPSVTSLSSRILNNLLIQESQGWKLIQHHGGHQSPDRDYTQSLANAGPKVGAWHNTRLPEIFADSEARLATENGKHPKAWRQTLPMSWPAWLMICRNGPWQVLRHGSGTWGRRNWTISEKQELQCASAL